MNDSTSKLATAIQSARKELHLSQRELGAKVGCSQTAVSHVENGDQDAVSEDTLKRICKKLNLDLADFVGVTLTDNPERLLFCPQATCPKNVPYLVNGKISFQPTVFLLERPDTVFCPGCGGALSERCNTGECGALVQVGAAFCMDCGAPFVDVPRAFAKHDDPKQLMLELIEQRKLLAETSVACRVALRQRHLNDRKHQ